MWSPELRGVPVSVQFGRGPVAGGAGSWLWPRPLHSLGGGAAPGPSRVTPPDVASQVTGLHAECVMVAPPRGCAPYPAGPTRLPGCWLCPCCPYHCPGRELPPFKEHPTSSDQAGMWPAAASSREPTRPPPRDLHRELQESTPPPSQSRYSVLSPQSQLPSPHQVPQALQGLSSFPVALSAPFLTGGKISPANTGQPLADP